jgi:ABC-type uncharacterized transport system fused permease/ATPase subunit
LLIPTKEWLFLDEATSSLDEESEERMYGLVQDLAQNELQPTTSISIAHRSTVYKHHKRVLTLDASTERRERPRDSNTPGFFGHGIPAANIEDLSLVNTI